MMINKELKVLIQKLSSNEGNDAQNAQNDIELNYGLDAVIPILADFSEKDIFPRRCAIELVGDLIEKYINHTEKKEYEKLLLPILSDTDEFCRTCVINTLRIIGSEDSISPLQNMYFKLKSNKTPLDWVEPIYVRSALRKLGSLELNLPTKAIEIMIFDEHFDSSCSVHHFDKILNIFSKNNQAIISIQVWNKKKDQYCWSSINKVHSDSEIDFNQNWAFIVKDSVEIGLKILNNVKTKKNQIVSFDWISESDTML